MEWMPANPHDPSIFSGAHGFFIDDPEYIAFHDGCQQAARKIVEWLKQLCITPNHIQCGLRRGCCPECIEQFCKEVGL
jgi:hypothetical protein